MKDDLVTRLLITVICGLFLTSFTACGSTGGETHVRWGKEAEEHPPVPQKGPPPHAPAHGYRAKYRYNYYPDVNVYLDVDRRLYFYLEGDEWKVSVSLPEHFRFRLGDHVTIEMDTDKPYTGHEDHKAKYPPGQLKKKDKGKS